MNSEEFLILFGMAAILALPLLPIVCSLAWLFDNGKDLVNNIWIDVVGYTTVTIIFAAPFVVSFINKINLF